MMDTIYLHAPKGLFAENVRDNCTEPFLFLREHFQKSGYVLKYYEGEDLTADDHVVFMDYASVFPYAWGSALKNTIKAILKGEKVYNVYRLVVKAGIRKNCILLLWEGPTASSYYYDKKIYDCFDRILSWDDDLVDGKKVHKLFLPGFHCQKPTQWIDFDKKKLLVNISMNKRSTWPSELYTERKKAVLFFDTYHSNDFDLYGYGWENEGLSTYRGITDNKVETLSKYKFSLCYENNTGLNGYVTEKIFDCMKAGTVPIYLGADNICEYVDKECFIDRRDFKDNEELCRFLKNVNELEYDAYRQAIKSYMLSELCKKFLSPYLAETISNALNL